MSPRPRQPDEGIWETRGGRKDFTYGRFQCWVAFDRAIRLAEHRGRPANIDSWRAERDKIYNQIMARGWNPDDEHGGAGKVELPAHVVIRAGADPEVAAALGIQQRREHARRIEPGTAETSPPSHPW